MDPEFKKIKQVQGDLGQADDNKKSRRDFKFDSPQ
jgi:hypothetical protein